MFNYSVIKLEASYGKRDSERGSVIKTSEEEVTCDVNDLGSRKKHEV